MKLNFSIKKENIKFTLKVIAIAFLVLLNVKTFAQNVGINATGASPDNAAMLDVVSTTKALLPPRVSLTATNVFAPVAPATSSVTAGFLVYNTATAGSSPTNVVPGYYYWSGTQWCLLSSSGSIGSGMFTGFSVYNTAGTSTWTLPTGVSKVMIEVWGGGGGGSGTCNQSGCTAGYAGLGGGSGAYFKGLVTVSSNLTVVVGAGGAGGSNSGSNATGKGSSGGTSSVTGTGVSIITTGGTGGSVYTTGVPGVGGSVTSTTGSIAGCTWSVAGYPGYWSVGGGDGGRGGSAPSGGQGGGNGYYGGQAGNSPGGGGSGSEGDSNCTTQHAGAAGAVGTVIIWW